MKILIDALSAREGGGVTYVRHILPPLAEKGKRYTFFVLALY